MVKVIGFLGESLSGKSSLVFLIGTNMTLEEKLKSYIPFIRRLISPLAGVSISEEASQKTNREISLSDVNNIKTALEGLLQRDKTHLSLYRKILNNYGLKFGEIELHEVIPYLKALYAFISEIDEEERALLNPPSEGVEEREIDGLVVKVFPGEIFRRYTFDEKAKRSLDSFIDDVRGKIVWVLSPKELYAIVHYYSGNFTEEEEQIVNRIISVEGKIKRKNIYFIITKNDPEEISKYRRIIETEKKLTREVVKEHIKREFGEENLDEELVKRAIEIYSEEERDINVAIEVYTLLLFSKYALDRGLKWVIYTSAKEGRNLDKLYNKLREV